MLGSAAMVGCLGWLRAAGLVRASCGGVRGVRGVLSALADDGTTCLAVIVMVENPRMVTISVSPLALGIRAGSRVTMPVLAADGSVMLRSQLVCVHLFA